jgi:uncharacterized membrane protein YphA (DoxX/SURF4 family)
MKKIKIAYWTVTILFVLAMLQSGIVQLIQSEGSQELMALLGYPMYVSTILGIAKILGAIVLVLGIFKTLKEWAYAGFAFDLIGATVSGAYIGEILVVIIPLVYLAVMFLSYFLWKEMEQSKMADVRTQVVGSN